MNYKITITGCYPDIKAFVSDFENGGYDFFRGKGRVLELMRAIIDNVSFTNGVMKVGEIRDNTCVISGALRKSEVGFDIAAFLGMSETYPALNFDVRCFCCDAVTLFGVNIRGGYFDNPYRFNGEGDIISVFFTYMCLVKFHALDKGLIRSGKGYIGSYSITKTRKCLASGAAHKSYQFLLDDNVCLEMEYRVTRNGDKQTFNVYRPDSKNDNNKSALVLSAYLMNNVRVETLAKMKNNRVAQVKRV